jgi:hypothetical protein
MTFKVNNGLQVGANLAIDSAALLQQIESTPSIRPSLLLDFAKAKTVDSRATFARTSSATVVGQDGVIRLVGNNQPRIEFTANGSGDCEGLLIELGRSNNFAKTEEIFDATWSKTNVNAAVNAGVAPDGTFTATRLYDTTDVGGTFHYFGQATGVTAGQTYTLSIFVKGAELTGIAAYPITSGNGAHFSTATGAFTFADTGATTSVKQHANGWYRVAVTVTSAVTGAVTPTFYLLTGGTNYIGTTKSLFVWGAQFENVDTGTTQVSSYIPSVETFTSRSSNATYIDNADGLLKTATTNTVRYNFNPVTRTNSTLLLEPAATNLALFSSAVASSAGGTHLNNSAVAPDGTTTAATMTEDTGNTRHFVSFNGATITANTVNTGSVFVKGGTRSKIYVWVGMSGAPYIRGGIVIDTTNGTYVVSNTGTPIVNYPTVQYVGNGWYRVSVAVLTTTSDTTIYLEVGGADAGNSTTYVGTSSTFFMWGCQLETGYGVTSYIPTGASTVTRAADVYTSSASSRANETLTIPRTSVNLKPYEGTVLLEGKIEGNITLNQYLYGLGDGTVWALISTRIQSNFLSALVFNATIAQGSVALKDYTGQTPVFKTAMSFSNTSVVGALDGAVIGSFNLNLGLPQYGTITIGGGFGSGVRRAYIKNFAYYPAKLSNNELISMTAS